MKKPFKKITKKPSPGMIECSNCVDQIEPCPDCKKAMHMASHRHGFKFVFSEYCNDECGRK